MSSLIAQHACAQSFPLCSQLQRYRAILPNNRTPFTPGGICRADGWIIGRDLINGDFDLDPALAQPLLSSLIISSSSPDLNWINEYLHSEQQPSNLNRIYQEAQGALVSPGSLPGNVNVALGTAHAAHASQTRKAIEAAARKITTGTSGSLRINSHIAIYNGNTTSKGRPRPKIRISNMPVKTVQPSLGPHATYNPRAEIIREALKNVKTQDLAMRTSPLKRTYLTSRFSSGMITFAPSAAIDLWNSIGRDTNGSLHFDARNFTLASARSQSGNLLGFTGGILIAPLAAGPISAAVLAFLAGFSIQVAWGYIHGPDYADTTVRAILDR